MTREEMQRQIESMMPTPKQIVENIDKKLEEKRLIMTQYIDKAAVIAEIEKRLDKLANTSTDNKEFAAVIGGQHYELYSLIQYINTLEVKVVDLDESARYYLLHEHISPLNEVLHQAGLKAEMQYHKDIEDAYKAGFELGIKTQKGGEE